MKRFVRVAGRAVAWVGWLAFLSSLALFASEKLGLLNTLTRELLAREAGSMGDDIAIERVVWRWFAPAIEIEGLTVGKDGESIRLEHTVVALELFQGAWIRASQIDVRGGHVRISPALISGVEGFSRALAARRRAGHVPPALPTIIVRGVSVDYDARGWGRLPLGTVDLVVDRAEDGSPSLTGRIVPSLGGAADGSGEIFLHGRAAPDDAFEITASAANLRLDAARLPNRSALDDARALDPSGTLALEAHGVLRWGDALRLEPGAEARLSITDGACRSESGAQRLDRLSLQAIARYAPSDAVDPWALSAWQGRAELHGRWNEQPFELCTRLGSEAAAGASATAWLHFAHLELDERVLGLVRGAPAAQKVWDNFEPRGSVELWAAVRCPKGTSFGDDLIRRLEIGVEVGLSGAAGMTYRGWPNLADGVRDLGFPLPIAGIHGTAVYARHPDRLRPFVVGLHDLTGDHGSGTIHGTGVIDAHPVDLPPYQPGYGFAELDLRFTTPEIAVDEALREALRGLSGAVHPADSWEPFQPDGGRAAIDVRLVRTADRRYAATHIALDLTDVGLAWKDLPVPLRRTHGHLEFASDGGAEHGLSLRLDSELATARALQVALRMQTDPDVAGTAVGRRIDELSYLSVAADRLSLTGDDKRILVAQHADIGAAMDKFAPRGFADVVYTRMRSRADGPVTTATEVTPRDPVQINPSDFKMITGDVRGRVLVTSIEERGAEGPPRVRVETRLAPLVGSWGPDVQVAFTANLPEEPLRFYGAGIDPSNKGLLGSLSQAMRTPGEVSDLDVTTLRVEGRLDLTAEFAPAGSASDGMSNRARIFLRDNQLSSGDNLRLDGISGVIDWHAKSVVGQNLDARIAGTPVAISEARFVTDEAGYRLTIRLRAEDLPLDRDHLRAFLSSDTVEALLGELKWRGWVDVDDAEIRIAGSKRGDPRIEFSGRVTPNDMSVQLGLPISVRSASARIEHLALEGGRVRAWGRIDDLYGEIAGRNLGPAALLFTYVEPRLSIESLSGEFEGGRVEPLGGEAARGGTVFSIDLEEPFPFQLALALEDVSVAGLLRGLFPSNVATKGLLNCQMRLFGSTESLLAIEGSGSILVRESRLWSVPVFRELFSQLGLDNTAIFDRMATNVRIKNGAIQMNDIAAHSPIVQLVGKGSVDFDGRLKHDLDVRYDLVDRLGPIARLLYSIQNKLLSVAIRGDMARPEVILKGPFTSLFGSRADRYRALPLPSFAELPPRF